MRIIKGNFGMCKFTDCLIGMRGIANNSYELAFADPPYNIGFQGFHGSPSKSKTIRTYSDSMTPNEYRGWCGTWFQELTRISERQIISPGLRNMSMWYRDQDVTDIFAIFDKTGSFGSRIATFATFQPLLFFGKFSQKILTNSCEVIHVFRSPRTHKWVHPTPRPYEVLEYIFERLDVASVIDPFLGSGTTAQVCETFGIEWVGFEIDETYASDIEMRLKIGKSKYRKKKSERHLNQKTLDTYYFPNTKMSS